MSSGLPLVPRSRAITALSVAVVVLLAAAGGVFVVRTAEGPAAALSAGAPVTPAPPRVLSKAGEFVDHTTLSAALAARGVRVMPGTNVYGARIKKDRGGLSYDEFDAGGGALDDRFWPASSVKVLAAVGALEYLGEQGFTGAAVVTMPGYSGTVRNVYQLAIRDSSNEAYDELLAIAGVDWLNANFLTAANGFPKTVIQRAYTGAGGVPSSPAMTVTQAGRTVQLPARPARGTPECAGGGNCSNLLELTESVRRVVLSEDVPEAERFSLASDDVQGLRDALLAAQGFVEPSVAAALGNGVLVYNKPGFTPGDECVDVALVNDLIDSERFLLAVSTPALDASCSNLTELAKYTLDFLRG